MKVYQLEAEGSSQSRLITEFIEFFQEEGKEMLNYLPDGVTFNGGSFTDPQDGRALEDKTAFGMINWIFSGIDFNEHINEINHMIQELRGDGELPGDRTITIGDGVLQVSLGEIV